MELIRARVDAIVKDPKTAEALKVRLLPTLPSNSIVNTLPIQSHGMIGCARDRRSAIFIYRPSTGRMLHLVRRFGGSGWDVANRLHGQSTRTENALKGLRKTESSQTASSTPSTSSSSIPRNKLEITQRLRNLRHLCPHPAAKMAQRLQIPLRHLHPRFPQFWDDPECAGGGEH